jgi:two-component system response regulator HydG
MPKEARLGERVGFESMIGHSQATRDIFQQIRMVAPTRATVRLRGESGTGKGLIANAIHQQSDRKRARSLPLNCAAIPSNLIEGEPFGHEKGAFAGADRTHPGKFQEADGGTLLLDEIGELTIRSSRGSTAGPCDPYPRGRSERSGRGDGRATCENSRT